MKTQNTYIYTGIYISMKRCNYYKTILILDILCIMLSLKIEILT